MRLASALDARWVEHTRRVGLGDALDPAKTMKPVADTEPIGAKMHHFAIARVTTELSIRAEGPFAMTYVNPADDHRKKH